MKPATTTHLLRPTLLTMPAWQRVVLVSPLIAVLWLAVWWALT